MNDDDGEWLEWPGWVLLPVVFGYLIFRRSFAALGIAPLYVGEATLGLLLLFRPEMILGTWLRAQLRPRQFATLASLAAIFVAYGFMQCVRGLEASSFPKIALQNFAFNFYIAFLFAGMWLGERHPNILPRVMWYLAWANGIYGLIFHLKLGQLSTAEDLAAAVGPTFDQPTGSAIAMLGLLAFEPNFRRSIIPLLLNAFVMLGMQVRAECLAFMVAVTLLAAVTGRVARLAQAGAIILGLLAVGLIVDFSIPSPAGRGGEISSRNIVGRIVASVDEDLAGKLTDDAEAYAGTISWRTDWWKALLEVTHKNTQSTMFGLGYGYPIWEHHPFGEGVTPTPHNIFIYVLTYTGWVGVFIFYSLQFYLAWMLWKAYRVSGQPFGICLWVLVMVWSHFDNKLEAPFGAIPVYVLLGIALTSGFAASSHSSVTRQESAGLS